MLHRVKRRTHAHVYRRYYTWVSQFVYEVFHEVTKFYMVLHDVRGCYTVLHNVPGCYMLLHGVTGCYRVLYGVTWCFTVLKVATQCYMVFHGVKGCYTVLHGVSGCYSGGFRGRGPGDRPLFFFRPDWDPTGRKWLFLGDSLPNFISRSGSATVLYCVTRS